MFGDNNGPYRNGVIPTENSFRRIEPDLSDPQPIPQWIYPFITVDPLGFWFDGPDKRPSSKVITKRHYPKGLEYYSHTNNNWVSSIFEAACFPGNLSDDEVLNFIGMGRS